MKSRVVFYCVAIAVLFATLAAAPSHATERRDLLLPQDSTQSQGSGHGSEVTAKPAKHSSHGKKGAAAKNTTGKKGAQSSANSSSNTQGVAGSGSSSK